MVGARRGTVRLEIVPWLTEAFGAAGSARLVLEMEIDRTMSLAGFLAALAAKYPAIGDAIVDLDAGRLFDHVSVVHNETVVGAHAALDEPIEAGDSVVLMPAFSGG